MESDASLRQFNVYEGDPEGYERLVAAEDWCGNLIPALAPPLP